MHKLLITANPSSKGLTHQIATLLSTLSEKNGDTVEILDLYHTELHQDFLRYEQLSDMANTTHLSEIQAKILKADELVFIFPIWWGDMPAILKNFWDCNFTAGFAFSYDQNGKSKGLLTGKTARVIATSGAPAFVYRIILHIQLLWNMGRIGFCGMKQKSCTILGGARSGRTTIDQYQKQIEKLV